MTILQNLLPVLGIDGLAEYGLAGWMDKSGKAFLNNGGFHTQNAGRINPENIFSMPKVKAYFGNWSFAYMSGEERFTYRCYAVMYALGYSHIGFNGAYNRGQINVLAFDAIRHSRDQKDTIETIKAIVTDNQNAQDRWSVKSENNSTPYCSTFERHVTEVESWIFENRALVLNTSTVAQTVTVDNTVITAEQRRSMWINRAGKDERRIKVEYTLKDSGELSTQVKREVPVLDMSRVMARFR